MNGLLDNKVCIVTGANRGIGLEIVRVFAEQGAEVYAICRNDKGVLQLSNNCKAENIHPLVADVQHDAQIKNAVMRIKKEAGRIDVLVNNAGVEYNEMIGMISQDNMEEMFKVNVFGLINFLQYTARVMQRQTSGGSIINISSVVGLKGNKGQLVYSATKGAVISVTKSAAKELAGKGIRVNSVAPGLTKTDMLAAADMDKLQDRISNIGMKRLAEPSDIANACLFLASDLSNYVTGQIIAVDGCAIM